MDSVQAGVLCYATVADAAAAVCAAHIATSTIVGTNIVTLSCAGSTDTGDVIMVSEWKDYTGSNYGSNSVANHVYFPQCRNGDIVDAGITILVAVASALVVPWGILKIIRFLNASRGEYNV